MKIGLLIMVICGLVLGQNASPKPDAKIEPLELGRQLLQRAQQAMGGAEKLAAIKDLTQAVESSVATTTGPLKGKYIRRFIIPNHLRTEGESKIGKTIIYTNGKSGWLVNNESWLPIPDEMLTLIKGELFRQLPMLLLSDRDASRTVKALGDNAVEITTKDRLKVRIEFDPGTGLPARHLYNEPISYSRSRKVSESFSDWREANGIKLPYQAVRQADEETLSIAAVSEYRINSGMTVEQLSKRP